MSDRWVNARITIVVPMDVSPDAEPHEKQYAAGEVMERLMDGLPRVYRHQVMSATWEDMQAEDPGPEPTIPDPPSYQRARGAAPRKPGRPRAEERIRRGRER